MVLVSYRKTFFHIRDGSHVVVCFRDWSNIVCFRNGFLVVCFRGGCYDFVIVCVSETGLIFLCVLEMGLVCCLFQRLV